MILHHTPLWSFNTAQNITHNSPVQVSPVNNSSFYTAHVRNSYPSITSPSTTHPSTSHLSTTSSSTSHTSTTLTSICELYSGVALDGKNQKSLEGIRILLEEDTPVLQRVATIMLEKMGATVTAVWDGQQAVDALNYKSINAQEHNLSEEETNPQSSSPYDLILMDCQMPKMDGYEATKAIRKAEIGTELHVPIVALTAHAMSSDEAKCLEVGMDAYLTKPIDRKLMVSTILSLTKPSTILTSFSD